MNMADLWVEMGCPVAFRPDSRRANPPQAQGEAMEVPANCPTQADLSEYEHLKENGGNGPAWSTQEAF